MKPQQIPPWGGPEILTWGGGVTMKTDKGNQLYSYQFEKYAKYSGFRHRKIAPKWPRANFQVK